MKRNKGFMLIEVVIFMLWVVGGVYVARDHQHCPEVGKTPYQLPQTGEWVCR